MYGCVSSVRMCFQYLDVLPVFGGVSSISLNDYSSSIEVFRLSPCFFTIELGVQGVPPAER